MVINDLPLAEGKGPVRVVANALKKEGAARDFPPKSPKRVRRITYLEQSHILYYVNKRREEARHRKK